MTFTGSNEFHFNLKESIGQDIWHNPRDGKVVREALKTLGFHDDPLGADTEVMDPALRDGIRGFQAETGLEVDGVMLPGGPTQQALNGALNRWQSAELGLEGTVGARGDNVPQDMHRVNQALAQQGYGSSPANGERPSGSGEFDLALAIRSFQDDHDLNPDGHMAPGGETDRALSRLVEADRIVTGEGDAPFRPQPKFMEFQNKNKSLIPDPENRNSQQPAAKNLGSASSRRQAILSGGSADFTVQPNPEADTGAPWYEIGSFSQVQEYDPIIEQEAKKRGVDPNLLRAIMHMETTHGYYDVVGDVLGINKSIRPMNINVEYWKGLGYSRDDLGDPKKNIEAGARLLKAIKNRMPNASIEQIATVYNNLGAKKVTDYGARVGAMYRNRPWEK